MKYVKLLLSLLVISFVMPSLHAQEKLTDAQKKMFQERVKQKVEEFQGALSNVVNDSLRHDIRKENVINLLKLFIGEGNPYNYYDEELEERVYSTGVKIQTSSIYNTNNQSQKLKKYVYKLYNPETGKSEMSYTEIVIESASAVRVDDIEEVGDHYECVAYFSQKFIGYKDGKVWYSDLTGKKIRCYIMHIDLPTGKRIFDAKLGDIYVLSTQKL